MIALLALAEAIRLAPPVDRPLHYRTTIRGAGGTVSTLDQEMRFEPAPGPAGTLAEEGDTRVAIATGLVLARSRTVRLLPADGTPPRLATATETRLLDP